MHISQKLKSTHNFSGPPPVHPNFNEGGGGGGSGKSGFHLDTCHHQVLPDPPPPPPLIPLTTPGGVWNTTFPSKNHLPPKSKNCFFAQFDHLSSERISGKTRRNFEKPREVFLHNGMKNNNLSQFFTGIRNWENQSHL
jgi:hypothetical protein